MENKIRTFHDLKVWQESHKLVIMIYKSTKSFPNEEMSGITNQLRRASISISSNISEGFGRRSIKDKIHFYTMALGSLNEVQNQVLISKDLNYLREKDWRDLEERIILISKMMSGLVKKSLLLNS